MIQKVFNWLIQPLGRVALLIAALAGLSLVVWGVNLTQATPAQPIEFPHTRHLAMGIQCLYCHPGATRGPSAGLPTPSKCWGCHQQIAKTRDPNFPELSVKLVGFVERNEAIPWVPVAQVPDFVQFNHRPHVASGLNCENCHGDVAKMGIYENPQVLNMGWCLNCHREKSAGNPELEKKLLDCGTCHY